MVRPIRAIARRTLLPAALGVAVSAVPAVERAEGARGPPQEDPVSVGGQIQDRATGEALEAARVLLRPDEGFEAPTRTAVSDADGSFEIPSVEPGPYILEVRHVGYGALHHHLRVPADDDVRLGIELVPEPIELSPVVATAPADISPRMVGFHERKDRGFGRFLSREDIEDRAPFRVSDLFRTMAGVDVQPSPGGHGGRLLMRGCEPAVYIDGVRTQEGARFIDEYLSTGELEAVEVYNVSETPAQFQHGACGAVVLWTRPPGTDNGRPWSWWRALVAASIVGFIFLR